MYNGYLYAAEETPEAAIAVSNVVYVVDADAAGTGFNAGTQKVKVMYTDGTTAIVTVDKYNGGKSNDSTYKVSADAGLVSYKVDTDGNYELTDLDPADYAYTYGDVVEGKVGGYRFNADAVIWVYEADGDVSVLTGADLAAWENTVNDVASEFYGSTKNGFGYIEFGFINIAASPGASGDAAYGVIVAAPVLVYEDDTYYAELTIWNGKANIEVVVELTAAGDVNNAEYQKGALVTYDVLSATEVENVAETGNEGAINAFDGTTLTVKGNPQEYVITEDTVVIYVDSDEIVGYEGGKIALAQKLENGNLYANVYFTQDDTDTTLTDGQDLLGLFVDVNTKWVPADEI